MKLSTGKSFSQTLTLIWVLLNLVMLPLTFASGDSLPYTQSVSSTDTAKLSLFGKITPITFSSNFISGAGYPVVQAGYLQTLTDKLNILQLSSLNLILLIFFIISLSLLAYSFFNPTNRYFRILSISLVILMALLISGCCAAGEQKCDLNSVYQCSISSESTTGRGSFQPVVGENCTSKNSVCVENNTANPTVAYCRASAPCFDSDNRSLTISGNYSGFWEQNNSYINGMDFCYNTTLLFEVFCKDQYNLDVIGIDCVDSECVGGACICRYGSYNNTCCGDGTSCLLGCYGGTCIKPQCSDGLNTGGNTAVDMADPSCKNPNDYFEDNYPNNTKFAVTDVNFNFDNSTNSHTLKLKIAQVDGAPLNTSANITYKCGTNYNLLTTQPVNLTGYTPVSYTVNVTSNSCFYSVAQTCPRGTTPPSTIFRLYTPGANYDSNVYFTCCLTNDSICSVRTVVSTTTLKVEGNNNLP